MVERPEIFYHVACMNHWKSVFNEHVQLLRRVGLAGPVTSAVLGMGRDVDWCVRRAAREGIELRICFAEADPGVYELPTLVAVQEWARSEPAAGSVALYFHTKGVSRPDDVTRQHWRRLMDRDVIANWRPNAARVRRDGFDIVGTAWSVLVPETPHFSGNFWMAAASWLARLPDIREYQRGDAGTICGGERWERMCCEMWLTSRPGFRHHCVEFDRIPIWLPPASLHVSARIPEQAFVD